MLFKNEQGLLRLTDHEVIFEDEEIVKTIEVKSGNREELEEIFVIEKQIMENMEKYPMNFDLFL